jgi:hypothetical protein
MKGEQQRWGDFGRVDESPGFRVMEGT